MKDWLDKLADEIADRGQEPPKGFKTRRDIQKHFGFKPSAASAWIKKAIDSGKMKKAMVRRPSQHGIRLVPYYGPK